MPHFLKNIFQWLPNEGDGAQPDRMQRYLQRSTRTTNKQLNDLWSKPSVWTPDLIKVILEARIKRYDFQGTYSRTTEN